MKNVSMHYTCIEICAFALADADLTEQDRERQLRRERVLERQRTVEPEGPDYGL